jgi:hypothetical protein
MLYAYPFAFGVYVAIAFGDGQIEVEWVGPRTGWIGKEVCVRFHRLRVLGFSFFRVTAGDRERIAWVY